MPSRVEQIGFATQGPVPAVSVVVLNYNGLAWLSRCLESLLSQTILDRIEVVVADNGSTDGSIEAFRPLLARFPRAVLVLNGANLGFCEGNNRGAESAAGEFLFFLNYDAWLEPSCLENLLRGMEASQADGGTPWVLNYDDNSHQDLGYFGFDVFGLSSPSSPSSRLREVFVATGCTLLIRRRVFEAVGRFDSEFFLYSDEVDLCWRVWIGGYRMIGVPDARAHHRGAANVNPAGGSKVIEFRTSDQKRYLSNRNCLLTLLKNGQHLLVLLCVPLTGLFLVEGCVGAVLVKRFSFIGASFLDPILGVWRLRRHVWGQRKLVAQIRKKSDFWMLRFLRLPLNRWFEIKRLIRFGSPKIGAR